jgi:hypothetical protein
MINKYTNYRIWRRRRYNPTIEEIIEPPKVKINHFSLLPNNLIMKILEYCEQQKPSKSFKPLNIKQLNACKYISNKKMHIISDILEYVNPNISKMKEIVYNFNNDKSDYILNLDIPVYFNILYWDTYSNSYSFTDLLTMRTIHISK